MQYYALAIGIAVLALLLAWQAAAMLLRSNWLLGWLRGFHKPPGHTFVVHGEAGASVSFAKAIAEQLGWTQVHLPRLGEYVTL